MSNEISTAGSIDFILPIPQVDSGYLYYTILERRHQTLKSSEREKLSEDVEFSENLELVTEIGDSLYLLGDFDFLFYLKNAIKDSSLYPYKTVSDFVNAQGWILKELSRTKDIASKTVLSNLKLLYFRSWKHILYRGAIICKEFCSKVSSPSLGNLYNPTAFVQKLNAWLNELLKSNEVIDTYYPIDSYIRETAISNDSLDYDMLDSIVDECTYHRGVLKNNLLGQLLIARIFICEKLATEGKCDLLVASNPYDPSSTSELFRSFEPQYVFRIRSVAYNLLQLDTHLYDALRDDIAEDHAIADYIIEDIVPLMYDNEDVVRRVQVYFSRIRKIAGDLGRLDDFIALKGGESLYNQHYDDFLTAIEELSRINTKETKKSQSTPATPDDVQRIVKNAIVPEIKQLQEDHEKQNRLTADVVADKVVEKLKNKGGRPKKSEHKTGYLTQGEVAAMFGPPCTASKVANWEAKARGAKRGSNPPTAIIKGERFYYSEDLRINRTAENMNILAEIIMDYQSRHAIKQNAKDKPKEVHMKSEETLARSSGRIGASIREQARLKNES